MDYIIRELTTNDYNTFLKLINDFRKTIFTEEDFINNLKTINTYSKIYVIEKNSELIATGTLIIEQKFIFNCSKLAHIEDVCVKKELRRNGYGKIIVNKLIEEAKKLKCYKITLTCSDDNKQFYISSGFENRGNQMSQLL
jgi:glucosamine-phosphate N-acetyltransferase